MTFVARTYEQILSDMIAYMQSRTSISDYNVGSVIRTILEAAALEDDEQYFQMVQLLDMFSAMVPVFPKDALYMTGVQILNEMWEETAARFSSPAGRSLWQWISRAESPVPPSSS
jgi:hypothetical protein